MFEKVEHQKIILIIYDGITHCENNKKIHVFIHFLIIKDKSGDS